MRTDSNLPRRSATVALALMCCALSVEAAAEAPAATLDCVVLPDAEADVGSATPGVITRVLVERGALVQAGQPLAELESSIERAELALSATRAELDADVALYTASAAYERRRLRRIETLHANHVVSSQERDKVDTETELAALRMRQANDRKRLARLELARAQAALDQRTVRSPFDGVVVQQYKVAGEFVDEQPLLRVARLHPLRVEVIVPNELFGSVLPGMRAKVQQQLPGSPSREATVRLIDPVGEPASGTFTVSMTLPNPKLSILAGTRCTARMVAGSVAGKPTTSAATAATTQRAGVAQQATVSHSVSADRHPPLAATLAVPRDRRGRVSRPTPPNDEPMAALPATTFPALVDAKRQSAAPLPTALPAVGAEDSECPPVVTASR